MVKARAPNKAHPVRKVLVALAAAAGAAAWVNRAAAKATEARRPPAGQFLRIGGVRLHYVERGAGPPVLLMHGNGATWEDFATSGLMDLLATRHRVLAFDRPGFGYSTRPSWRRWTAAAQAALLMKAARRLGADSPVVVGHSWGALVALHMGIAQPGRIAGIVLLAGYLVPEARADVRLLALLGLPLVGRLLNHTVVPLASRPFAKRAVRRIFSPDQPPECFYRGSPLRLALRPSQLLASAQDLALMNASADSAGRRLHRLTMPVAIIAGSDDAIVSTARHSVALHRRIGGSALAVIRGRGHMVHYFAKDNIAAAVAAVRGDSAAPPERAFVPGRRNAG